MLENAAQEMEKVGPSDHPEWRQKYTMRQLLDPDFRLPLPDAGEPVDLFEHQLGKRAIGGLVYDEVS